ncbi:MAG: ATP-binding protein [Verrucomicrobiaceae bacterium]|nr:ATP-binding protein [Verrucomicrobiaceae bacterium]
MNSTGPKDLPPNPYKRSPIRRKEDLAGRTRELKSIRYYLGLTAAGQSPHLALIGQRGVGKTSLLNGAEGIAADLKLLTVRLDMNELKANSAWLFWHDLYQALALSMVKAGCWGGIHGTIYAHLLQMIHSRQTGAIENAVLQVPYVFSCHQGKGDDFECPDALVVHDFETCLIEVKSKGYRGIALLIDEADCLGKNVPLLQMFRNIFQVVEHCSLLLAGTEAVFPALSEVFSPIPRQFHRIDILPFASWSDTFELIMHPLPKELRTDVAPELDVVQGLHELCGGAPDEVQLYCHHMYRCVEDGTSKCMALEPQVFRAVLREYRSNSPANIDAVITAIERLPDNLLFESIWLSLRKLSIDENICVAFLSRELKSGHPMSAAERDELTRELIDGYSKLHQLGITKCDHFIHVVGAPLTSGFWKSYVEVERGKRWTWDDDSFSDNLQQAVLSAMGRDCGAEGQIAVITGPDAVIALESLRAGAIPKGVDSGMPEMVITAMIARESKVSHVLDLTYQIDSPAGRHTYQSRFLEKLGDGLPEEKINDWIQSHHELLKGNNITITVNNFKRWELPNDRELHRLAYISEHSIPEIFGPSRLAQAITMFADGNSQGCMDMFKEMLADREDSQIRNNLAFCELLRGQVASALENSAKAVNRDYEPIYGLNNGLCQFINGDNQKAIVTLREALNALKDKSGRFTTGAAFVLILEADGKTVNSHDNLPVDAAILVNLWRMNAISLGELKVELEKVSPDNCEAWLVQFGTLEATT